jgi:hypothetical protein
VPIRAFLEDVGAFDPETVFAMGEAFESACRALQIESAERARDRRTREVVAIRIIELVRRGETDPKALVTRVVKEASGIN